MNTNLRMPSGSEVEAAAFHEPVGLVPVDSSSSTSSRRAAMRDKLDSLRARSLSKVHDAQQLVSTRSSAVKTNVQRSVNDQMSKIQTSMQSNPAKWAGIAAGSGFALGLIGRVLHWRSKQHRHRPEIVIIDAMC
jgi:ElaB/YqjD/DUF883 family membrane-anchored ribosome-binding protein